MVRVAQLNQPSLGILDTERAIEVQSPRREGIIIEQRRDPQLLEIAKTQDLIITQLQRIAERSEEHHALAETEADRARKMEATISELRGYLAETSARRQLTIWSFFLLLVSSVVLLIVMIRGPLTISSPFPEFAVCASLVLLLMARFAPQYQK